MKKLITAILCILFAFSLTACNDSFSAEGLEDSYEISAGKEFCLPYITGVEYECGDGSLVINGNFVTATEAKTYTVTAKIGKKEKTFSINVKDDTPPVIRQEHSFKYAPVGEIEISAVDCFDEVDGFITASAKVYDDSGNEVQVSGNRFIAEHEGEYKVVYSAKDKSGNEATADAMIFASDDPGKADVLFPMESSWAQSKFFRHWNMNQSYSTEKKISGEAGSTKISFTADLQPWAGCAFIKEVLITDISEYKYLTFSIYNDSEYKLVFRPQWVKTLELTPYAWTEVKLNVSDLKNGSIGAIIKEQWNVEDANGFALVFYDAVNLFERFDVYVSNIKLTK